MRLKTLIAVATMGLALAGQAQVQSRAQSRAQSQDQGEGQGVTPFRPVAVVNDSVITGFDLAQRAQLLSLLGYPASRADQLRTDALDQLIEDKLKLQAGKQMGITPTPEMIASGVEQYARQANVAPDAFRASLTSRGVTSQAIDDMVGAQMVWLNVVRTRFAGRVEPAESEIDAELAQRASAAATEYRISEIGLPLQGDGRTEAETRALAARLSETLNQGGDFQEAVARYSDSPSAARGGEVGWVTAGSMPPELRQTLAAMQVGQVSRPIQVSGGISILKVEDKRQSAAAPGAEDGAREAVRTQLMNQRSERLAEGLLQEMRRDALIQVR
jgi:peptidyl-prolyl cis-trans isomerase SurA